MKLVLGWGLSVLRGIFSGLKNRHFTGVLRGVLRRTISEQDKAGSLGPADPPRTATPTGDYGYVEGVPGIQRERSGSKPESHGFFRLIFRQIQAKIPA